MTTAIVTSAILVLGAIAVAVRPVKQPVPVRAEDRR